jgi:release factor glutamine methyltransferase
MTGWAIERLHTMDVARPVVIDLGAGCGAIALAIAQEVPQALVHAVEVQQQAWQWAQKNIRRALTAASGRGADRAGDRPQVVLYLADLTVALPELDGTVDLVISNPP